MSVFKFLTAMALTVSIISIVKSSLAEDTWRFPTDQISTQDWKTYLDETLAKPGVNAYEAAGQIIIEIPQEAAVYVFTADTHPAYPAVVKRQAVERDGRIVIDRKGHYAGDRAAFDYWWKQFDELDRGVRDSVQ